MRRKEDDDDETARGRTRRKNEGKERMTNNTVLDTGVRILPLEQSIARVPSLYSL